jgi:uncharacterized membrane protein
MHSVELESERKVRDVALIVYILQFASLIAGVTALIGVIVNYLKRDEAAGTLYESHFTWQIRTFWGAVIGAVVGGVTWWFFLGFLVWGATYVWFIYRVVRGFLNFNDGKPMPL